MDTATTLDTLTVGSDVTQDGINYKILNTLNFPNSIDIGAQTYNWIVLDTTCTYPDKTDLPNTKKYFNDIRNDISYMCFY